MHIIPPAFVTNKSIYHSIFASNSSAMSKTPATATSKAKACAASAPPQAVLFDAYGTLFDVYSVALLAEQLFPGRAGPLSLLWRDKQIEVRPAGDHLQ